MKKHSKVRLFSRWALLATLVSLTALTVTPAPVAGGTEGASGDLLVSIQARDLELPKVLGVLASQIGAKLAIEEGVTGKISLELHDAKLTHVMDNICSAYACRWSLSKGQPLVLLVQAEPAKPR